MISAIYRHGRHSRRGSAATLGVPIRRRSAAGLPTYPTPTCTVRGLAGDYANGNSRESKLARDD
jgi:hypothetical protein